MSQTMTSSYRALLRREQAPSLALACGLGWLALSGYALAIILAVRSGTHSFAVAGGTLAAFSAGSGVFAPLRGRLIDRHGPKILGYLATGHLAGMVLLLVECATGHRPLLLIGAAALAGSSAPPIIATARSMWTEVAGPGLARTGHALNAALSDVAQISSPPMIGAIAFASPVVALAAVAVGAASAAWMVALRPRHLDPDRRAVATGSGIWLVLRESRGLRTIVVCDLAIGGWLGSLEVAVTSVAASSGIAELAAVPLATSAVGSIAISLWTGSRRTNQSPGRRYVAGTVVVAVAMPLTLLAQSIAPIAVILVIVGAGFGLLNVAVFELLDEVSPPGRATEAFTWLTTSQAAGLAIGAAAAGRLAQIHPGDALVLVCGFAAVAAIVALASRGNFKRIGPVG